MNMFTHHNAKIIYFYRKLSFHLILDATSGGGNSLLSYIRDIFSDVLAFWSSSDNGQPIILNFFVIVRLPNVYVLKGQHY